MSSDSESKNSYQQVYTQANQPNQTSNLKVIDKNAPDSEIEQKTEKKINKKLLKNKEG